MTTKPFRRYWAMTPDGLGLVIKERMAGANMMIEKIDHLIVRMNGQSTPYRDELESIVTEYGFWVPRGKGSGDSSSHGG